jgi:hypothetical protein
MSREDFELSIQSYIDETFARGAGDPDAYGYPGEPDIIIIAEDFYDRLQIPF